MIRTFKRPRRVINVEEFKVNESAREGKIYQKVMGVYEYLNVALKRDTEEKIDKSNSGGSLG